MSLKGIRTASLSLLIFIFFLIALSLSLSVFENPKFLPRPTPVASTLTMHSILFSHSSQIQFSSSLSLCSNLHCRGDPHGCADEAQQVHPHLFSCTLASPHFHPHSTFLIHPFFMLSLKKMSSLLRFLTIVNLTCKNGCRCSCYDGNNNCSCGRVKTRADWCFSIVSKIMICIFSFHFFLFYIGWW